MSKIFISYRRVDTAFVAGQLRQNLIPPLGEFHPQDVFLDVDGIPLGEDIYEYIDHQVSQCAVMLILIGRDWLWIKDKNGNRRLDLPNDPVRLEVEAALRYGVRIIPLLIGDVEMPTAADLPPSIAKLANRSGTSIRPEPYFSADIARLVKGIERVLRPAEPALVVTPQPPAPIDYRRFRLLNTLEGHTGQARSCAFSPDGRILASASNDNTVRLWDMKSKHLLHILEHTSAVNNCTFSPDGHILASASGDETVRLWDVRAKRLLHTLQGHTAPVWGCAFSPDGRMLASASDDKTLQLWDAVSKRLLYTIEGHKDAVRSCTFSPDGRILASASFDKTVRLWDIESKQLLHTLEWDTNPIWDCSFSPDGRVLVSASWDGTIRLWDMASKQLLHTLKAHTFFLFRCSFSPDERILASVSSDKVLLWDMISKQPLHTLEGHTNAVYSCAFSPDGRILATTSEDQTVRLWGVD